MLCTGCSITPLYQTAESENCMEIDVIAEREGQKLRRYLKDSFRDLSFVNTRKKLSVTINKIEKPFAISDDGNAKRLLLTYVAHVVLKDHNNKVVYENNISTSISTNISNAQGEVLLSLYGNNNSSVLKELAYRITENIRMFLINED